jgi:trigger factor
MVAAEFEQIWEQLKHEATHEPDPEAALAEMEAEKDDYQAIAERRVRLGLLLSEIGQANGIEVTGQEMNRLISQAAMQYAPQDQQRFVEYIRNEPMAAAQLRAPLYEDKVVDFLFSTAEITDREVTREQLEEAIESEDGFATGTHHHDHDNHKPKAAKKAAAKKPAAKADKADNAKVEEPVKKAATKKAPSKSDAKVEAPADELKAEEPVKKAATKKAPAAKAETAEEAPAKKPAAKKAPAKK